MTKKPESDSKRELVAQIEKAITTLKQGTDVAVMLELERLERLIEQWRNEEGK